MNNPKLLAMLANKNISTSYDKEKTFELSKLL